MSTSLYCYQPGDIVYVQAAERTPIRSYEVQTNGTLREVSYDSPSSFGSRPPGPSSSSISSPPVDSTRSFQRHGKS